MKQRFALITGFIASLIVLSGCGGTTESLPTPSIPHATASGSETVVTVPVAPSATPATVDAYQAIGKLNGIIGEGNDMKCDPSLATVALQSYGGREWNGTTFKVDSEFVGTSEVKNGVRITPSEAPTAIKSGILRLYKGTFTGDDGKTLTALLGTQDLAFNTPSNWHENDVLSITISNFDVKWMFASQLERIDLCVEPRGLAN